MEELNRITGVIVDCAFAVHSELGPGLLESVYEACLAYELRHRGLAVETQVILPVEYKNVRIETGLRLDMLVENKVVVELKAVETLAPIHTAQLMTYLKLSRKKLGLLLIFNVPLIRDGIKRVIL